MNTNFLIPDSNINQINIKKYLFPKNKNGVKIELNGEIIEFPEWKQKIKNIFMHFAFPIEFYIGKIITNSDNYLVFLWLDSNFILELDLEISGMETKNIKAIINWKGSIIPGNKIRLIQEKFLENIKFESTEFVKNYFQEIRNMILNQ